MEIILFWTYIVTIVSLAVIIIIIKFAWGDYIPRRWIIHLSASFLSLIIGLCALLGSELLAPFSADFYLNSFLYLTYIGLLGCSMFIIYLLVFEIHYKHVKIVQIAGWIAFSAISGFIVVSCILIQTTGLTSYLWIIYASIESVLGLGIAAYVLLAMGSFSDAGSDRLDREARQGLNLIGIFCLGIASALGWIVYFIFFIDFSVALHPAVSIFWLIWMVVVEVIFLLIIRGAVRYIT